MRPEIVWQGEGCDCTYFKWRGHTFRYFYDGEEICAQVLRSDDTGVIQKCFPVDGGKDAREWLEKQTYNKHLEFCRQY